MEEYTKDVQRIKKIKEDVNLSVEKIYKNPKLNDFPVVYIYYKEINTKHSKKYCVYVGETMDFIERNLSHKNSKDDEWYKNIEDVFIIANKEFNRSLTMDIESKLILYLSSAYNLEEIYNKKTNFQRKYSNSESFEDIFNKIWDELNATDSLLFQNQQEIENSAIYKASPFHSLYEEQENAKDEIIKDIKNRKRFRNADNMKKIMWIDGGTGTGKTVLLSSVFNYVINNKESLNSKNCIIVNHKEQFKIYQDIFKRIRPKDKLVFKPTNFLKRFSDEGEVFDNIFIDEGHLLLTQKNQAFTDKNEKNKFKYNRHLYEIARHAKRVFCVFDINQVISSNQYILPNEIVQIFNEAKKDGRYRNLEGQLRIKGNEDTIDWIDSFTKEGIIKPIKYDENYEIKVFKNPEMLCNAIMKKDEKFGLCRMVASYDWEYKDSKKNKGKQYCVEIKYNNDKEIFKKPWNWQSVDENGKRIKNETNISWAENSKTIEEVGSVFTIQGSDLNYVGVILGPSVKYKEGKDGENGKIDFDYRKHKNHGVTQRSLEDGKKIDIRNELIKNEVRVLMTRGIKGLYIYACNDELREKLLECQNNNSIEYNNFQEENYLKVAEDEEKYKNN